MPTVTTPLRNQNLNILTMCQVTENKVTKENLQLMIMIKDRLCDYD